MTTYMFWCMLANITNIGFDTITWDVIAKMDEQINDDQFDTVDAILKR